jgi:hypothetical protein
MLHAGKWRTWLSEEHTIMTHLPTSDDVAYELKAALKTRQELGPDYDEHVLQAFAETLTRQMRREAARQRPPKPRGLGSGQRTAVAIMTLIAGVPMVAFGAGFGQLSGLGLVVLLLLGINLAVRI